VRTYYTLAALVLVVLSVSIGRAQSELTLYNMPNVPKINSINPAVAPWAGVYLGLPVISNVNLSAGSDFASLAELGFSINPIQGQFEFDEEADFEDVLLMQTGDKNQFISSNIVDLLSFGGRIKKGFFSFVVSEQVEARLAFPRDLIRLFDDLEQEDPTGLLGEVYNLSNLSLIGAHYRTYNLSYSYDLNRDLSVGARVGYVQGLGNSFMEPQNYSVIVTPNGFEAMGEIRARNAGLQFLYDDEEEVGATDYLLASGNSGLVFGVGGQYRLSPKLDIAASVNNIGGIKWKNNIGTAVLTETFTEEQEDLGVYSEALFEVNTESTAAYRTSLPTSFSVQANYYVLPNISVSGLLYSSSTNGISSTSISLAGNLWLGKIFNVTTALHYVQKKIGLGLGGALNLGPVQLYAASDNAINLLTGGDVNRVHFTGGVYFTFQRLSHQENLARLDGLDSEALVAGDTATTTVPEEELSTSKPEKKGLFAFGNKDKQDDSSKEMEPTATLEIPEEIVSEEPTTTTLMAVEEELPTIEPIKERSTPATEQAATSQPATENTTSPPANTVPAASEIPDDRVVFLDLKQDANMYLAPTAESTMIRRMFSGTTVKLREKVNSNWWKVSWGAKTGFMQPEAFELSNKQYTGVVAQTNISVPSQVEPAPQPNAPETSTFAEETIPLESFFVTEPTSFRREATHKSGVILRFEAGDKVDLLEKTDRWWWKVKFKGSAGWVKAALLEKY